MEESLLLVSVLTLGELRKGIENLADGQRKARIQKWFEQDVVARFHNRILSADLDICLRWGELSAESEKTGRPRPAIDTLLASTALVHNLRGCLGTHFRNSLKIGRLDKINPLF